MKPLRGLSSLIKAVVIVIILLLAVVVFMLIKKANAHGEHDWIRENNYKSETGSPCCGFNDCMIVEAHPTRLGYVFYNTIRKEHELIPHELTLSSEDNNFWFCYKPDGTRRCFFAPQASF